MQRTESGQRFLQAIALVQAERIGKLRVTCGINGFGPSPVIPVAPVPPELDWDTWLGPAPRFRTPCLKSAKVTVVEYRSIAIAIMHFAGGVPRVVS